MASRGMGRGLAAILPEPAEVEPDLRELPLDQVVPSPGQPRKRFDPDSIAELAGSIAAAGIVQPIIVRPLPDGRHEIVAGERRWRAAREAGLDRLPALVREQAEAERLQTALIENVVREDLNPVDEARALAALVEELGVSKEDVAGRIGKSRAAVSNLIRLLDLPDQALELLESGTLTEGHGRAILQAKGQDARRRLAREAARREWSVRETERRARADGEPRRRPEKRTDPDREAALAELAEALEDALGQEVRVRAAGDGIRAELRFADLDEALAKARSLRRG